MKLYMDFNEDIYIDFKSALKIAVKSTNEVEDLAIYTKDNKFLLYIMFIQIMLFVLNTYNHWMFSKASKL